MRTIITTILISSLLIPFCIAQIDIEPKGLEGGKGSRGILSGFRDFNFYCSTDEIIKNEKSERIFDSSDDNVLSYSDFVANKKVNVFYFFVDNKFLMGGYYFEENHSNENLYIDDFDDVDKLLSQKYGKPDYTDMIWSDDLYRDNPNEWGFAVSLGDLSYRSEWVYENGIIIHSLIGDNYVIQHLISYRHNDYDQKKKKKSTDKL